jgi:NAD+ kinase
LNSLRRVGFVVNEDKAGAVEVAAAMHRALDEHGVEVCECHEQYPERCFDLATRLDLMFSFGGDGTILRAARLAAPLGVPIVGVNLGRVGFLTEVAADEALTALPRFIAGDYWIEERLLLQGELVRDGSVLHTFTALNDIVVNRGGLSRVVECTLSVNGAVTANYVADGVIISTPTGSTAYCLAAGGPILTPDDRSIAIVPIAPYLALIRALVVPDDAVIELLINRAVEALITIDGQLDIAMKIGDIVRVRRSETIARFARIQPHNYFTASIVERLRLRG